MAESGGVMANTVAATVRGRGPLWCATTAEDAAAGRPIPGQGGLRLMAGA